MRKCEAAYTGTDGTPRYIEQMIPVKPFFESAFAAFTHGTIFQSVQGPVAIEDLEPGTHLETLTAGVRQVTWVGTMMFNPQLAPELGGGQVLTRIAADAFGLQKPAADLTFGPAARRMHRNPATDITGPGNDILQPVTDFIDGESAAQIFPRGPVRLYHFMLDRHAVVSASGLPVESFHPGREQLETLGPNTQELFMSLFPHLHGPDGFGRVCMPRLSAAQAPHEAA